MVMVLDFGRQYTGTNVYHNCMAQKALQFSSKALILPYYFGAKSLR